MERPWTSTRDLFLQEETEEKEIRINPKGFLSCPPPFSPVKPSVPLSVPIRVIRGLKGLVFFRR
jgi:hypothetical protein